MVLLIEVLFAGVNGSFDLHQWWCVFSVLLSTGADPGIHLSGDVRYGERFAQAYNGCLGAEPPTGSRGRAPGVLPLVRGGEARLKL